MELYGGKEEWKEIGSGRGGWLAPVLHLLILPKAEVPSVVQRVADDGIGSHRVGDSRAGHGYWVGRSQWAPRIGAKGGGGGRRHSPDLVFALDDIHGQAKGFAQGPIAFIGRLEQRRSEGGQGRGQGLKDQREYSFQKASRGATKKDQDKQGNIRVPCL